MFSSTKSMLRSAFHLHRSLLSPAHLVSSSLLGTLRTFTSTAAMSTANALRVAVCQLEVGADKAKNLQHMHEKVVEASRDHGAKLVVLPECFTCPYGNDFFPQYAEADHSETAAALEKAASYAGVYLVGGSFPERDGDKLYNTCLVYSPEGTRLGKFRKMHLFDIDIPGGITFQESKTLTAGSGKCTFDIKEFGIRVGVGICFDIRFPELAMLYAQEEGCNMLVYPGAFNMTTGPKHWELLGRARAVDSQSYAILASPARDTTASYIAWGHSAIVDPWGAVIANAEEKGTIIAADVDAKTISDVRAAIPCLAVKRNDVYSLQWQQKS